MKVLISFLGKKPQGKSYPPARYDFGNGTIRETSFFSLALCEEIKPDRLVILGTAASMWDVLVDHLAGGQEESSDLLGLMEAVEKSAVSEVQLKKIAPIIAAKLGCDCRLGITPYGKDDAEQTKILRLIARDVADHDHVTLDLTHSLRHLPILGMISALYLREARKAVISGIYYGAFELIEDGVTPVIRLDGLMQVADWIRALAVYEGNGDYGVFAPLLEAEGVPGKALAEAAFFERIFNPEKARQRLTTIPIAQLREKRIAGLFAEQLAERIAWYKKSERSEQEKELAWTYFDKKDYVRAVTYGYEALSTLLVGKAAGNICDFNARDKAIDDLAQRDEQVRTFKCLRNELVHGSRTVNANIQKIVDDQQLLEKTICDFLRRYLVKRD